MAHGFIFSGSQGGKTAGDIIQRQYYSTGAVASTTTALPADDTIPQNTEGAEAFTLSITPTNVNSTLAIKVVLNGAPGTSARSFTAALFKDADAGAIAVSSQRGESSGSVYNVVINHSMTSGTTSSITFKVRYGSETGGTSTTLNGNTAARNFGGTMSSSIEIIEYATGTLIAASGSTGTIVQVVNTQTGAVATGTTSTPDDDTIPQSTEGDQYMTLAITPTSASNKLLIYAVANWSTSGNNDTVMALHQDSTANALAACRETSASPGYGRHHTLVHYMTAGTTSSTTFKIRIGNDGATLTFNGVSGARVLGGVMASSITIYEIKV